MIPTTMSNIKYEEREGNVAFPRNALFGTHIIQKFTTSMLPQHGRHVKFSLLFAPYYLDAAQKFIIVGKATPNFDYKAANMPEDWPLSKLKEPAIFFNKDCRTEADKAQRTRFAALYKSTVSWADVVQLFGWLVGTAFYPLDFIVDCPIEKKREMMRRNTASLEKIDMMVDTQLIGLAITKALLPIPDGEFMTNFHKAIGLTGCHVCNGGLMGVTNHYDYFRTEYQFGMSEGEILDGSGNPVDFEKVSFWSKDHVGTIDIVLLLSTFPKCIVIKHASRMIGTHVEHSHVNVFSLEEKLVVAHPLHKSKIMMSAATYHLLVCSAKAMYYIGLACSKASLRKLEEVVFPEYVYGALRNSQDPSSEHGKLVIRIIDTMKLIILCGGIPKITAKELSSLKSSTAYMDIVRTILSSWENWPSMARDFVVANPSRTCAYMDHAISLGVPLPYVYILSDVGRGEEAPKEESPIVG